jgi:hypothetical protein
MGSISIDDIPDQHEAFLDRARDGLNREVERSHVG